MSKYPHGDDGMLSVSIIIPHYNNSKYIEDCLVSIAKQTYKNYEVIIVDDCSLPKERNVAKQLANKFHCTFLANKKNCGVSVARNKGLELGLGDILTTIDPDDFYIDTCYLERVVSRFLCSTNSVVGTKAIYVNQEGALITRKVTKKVVEGNVKAQLFARTCYIPINIFYTSKMLQKIGGYNSKYKSYEDWDFKLRLANHYEFVIEDVEIAYRIHDHGLSTLGRFDKIKKLLRVFLSNFHLLKYKEKILVMSLILKSLPAKANTIIASSKY